MSVIAIDVRMLGASGIGRYLEEVVSRLVAARPARRYRLIGDAARLASLPWTGRPNVELVESGAPIYSLREQLELPSAIGGSADLFWAPHYNVPVLQRRPLVVTIHDVLHLARPEFVPGLHRRLYAHLLFRGALARARGVICGSAFTADEVVRLLGVPRARLRVVHYGVSPFWSQCADEARPHPRPYLLFVGNVKPHKNLVGLIDAFASLADEIPHDLVIVGKREGFLTGDPRVAARAAPLGDRVRFTGWIDDAAIRAHYRHADALVFPSFYEGFGLPPLEAMAGGCPVIVSRAASLPEACGDAALYCDPFRPADIAARIKQLLGDGVLRAELRERGLDRARSLRWDHCMEETDSVFATAMEE
jgi:glycosyltransferase involved in cell wall biosynthesis